MQSILLLSCMSAMATVESMDEKSQSQLKAVESRLLTKYEAHRRRRLRRLSIADGHPVKAKKKQTDDVDKEGKDDGDDDGNPHAVNPEKVKNSKGYSGNGTDAFYHYEVVEDQYNDTKPLPWAEAVALEKNLSTTKTAFLPSEKDQPERWPETVGILFLGMSTCLIVATIVRKTRSNKKRGNYEEVQSLIV
jgi:hypothetical protein